MPSFFLIISVTSIMTYHSLLKAEIQQHDLGKHALHLIRCAKTVIWWCLHRSYHDPKCFLKKDFTFLQRGSVRTHDSKICIATEKKIKMQRGKAIFRCIRHNTVTIVTINSITHLLLWSLHELLFDIPKTQWDLLYDIILSSLPSSYDLWICGSV